jgi:hypothetical protein
MPDDGEQLVAPESTGATAREHDHSGTIGWSGGREGL